MATKKDLSQLTHLLVPSTLHFYYETLEDGTNVLRHIRVNQRTFDVPADGITIDTLPPDSVGTREIEDGAIIMDDLSPEARVRMENKFATDDDVRTALGL